MRVSSLSFYNTTLTGIRDQQSNIARLSQQIATEKTFLAAKDAPVESARAMQLADQISARTQHQANQLRASMALKEENLILNEMEDTISAARDLAVGANASLNLPSRTQLATQLANFGKTIEDLANSKDSAGNYLFAGYQTDTQPYAYDAVFEGAAAPQVTTFAGDAGQRQLEIETGRYVRSNDSVESVLQSGTNNDLLRRIDDLAVALRDGTVTQTDLNDAYALMTNALGALRETQSSVAGRQLEVKDTQDLSRSLLAADQDALGELTKLDTAAAIVELQLRQVTLQAAESAFGLTSKQSLFSYL